ncbi:MAG: heavy-metal-associated domain-containing protein [Thermomicrobiales bacterium]|nr:heavy-metal-associated domain-containing protein [Thermomicrobiales bacterium]
MMRVASPPDAEHVPVQQRALIRILDFSCAGESAGLERRLRRVAGVSSVTVNPLTETAYVTFDPGRTNVAELEFVATAAGYRVQ